MKDKLVYVAHPFAGDPKGNIEKVKAICRKMMKMEGITPLAPHLALTFVDEATDRQYALKCGLRMLEACDEVWVCCKPRDLSDGVQSEMAYALELGIPVCMMWEATNENI